MEAHCAMTRCTLAFASVLLLAANQLQLFMPVSCAYAQSSDQGLTAVDSDFSTNYTQLTKKILLAGIAIERYSLNYRLETGKQPPFRKLRYFASQEAGAGAGLAFEVVGLKQFGLGRRHPLKISKRALKGATITAMVGSIVAGGGSCAELGSNAWHAIQLKRKGFDGKSANKFVAGKLSEIDQLLGQRDSLVAANSSNPAYDRAVAEGKVLRCMRGAFINEYDRFHSDTNTYRAIQNSFFLLNAGYNAIGATAAGLAYKAVDTPKLNGPANILFIVSGATAAATPFLCSASGYVARKFAQHSVVKALGEKPHFDAAEFTARRKELDALTSDASGSLISSLPGTQRLALYTESNSLFVKQLESQERTMRSLRKVALGSVFLAPPIGGLLMTQGILGTHGYYDFTFQPRKQIDQYYRGAIVGTVGTSMSVVGNAALLLASMSYEHHLKKKESLPYQLIRKRLDHLAETELLVSKL